jgi:hypothetical protein
MTVPHPPAPGGGIPLPQQPHDPPTLPDVRAAIRYSRRTRLNHHTQQPNSASEDDTARAAVYKTNVLVAHGAAHGAGEGVS